jgi:hypothetical protein
MKGVFETKIKIIIAKNNFNFIFEGFNLNFNLKAIFKSKKVGPNIVLIIILKLIV